MHNVNLGIAAVANGSAMLLGNMIIMGYIPTLDIDFWLESTPLVDQFV
jgi:hypothetical protein